jgi:ClpP class serine protease
MVWPIQHCNRLFATEILDDLSRKAINQVVATVERILSTKMSPEQATAVAQKMATGIWTHDYPIMPDEAQEMGLPVTTEMPEAVHELMALYPQPQQQRPSVQYIPAPYGGNERNKSQSLLSRLR